MIQIARPPAVAGETDPGAVRHEADAADRQILLDGVVQDFAQLVGDVAEPDAGLVEEQNPGAFGAEGERAERAAGLRDFLHRLKGRIRDGPDRPVSILVPQQGPAARWGESRAMDRAFALL